MVAQEAKPAVVFVRIFVLAPFEENGEWRGIASCSVVFVHLFSENSECGLVL